MYEKGKFNSVFAVLFFVIYYVRGLSLNPLWKWRLELIADLSEYIYIYIYTIKDRSSAYDWYHKLQSNDGEKVTGYENIPGKIITESDFTVSYETFCITCRWYVTWTKCKPPLMKRLDYFSIHRKWLYYLKLKKGLVLVNRYRYLYISSYNCCIALKFDRLSVVAVPRGRL